MTSTNSAQQFCVRWNSYQSNLQNSFPKLLLNEHFVDVSLACEGQLIKCHKVVLSACSTYFEQMLSQNPCQHPIIFMKDMKFWEVRALVDFMYRGEVNVTQEELSSLLKAAEALQVRGLYGYEQQRAAAAAAACTKTEGSNEEQPKTPSLPASTTVQECTSNSRPSSPQQEDSNDQMVKLEEEIMMMEEQSISDMDSHLENDFAPLGNSQDFDGFVGDQRYPPPPHCGEMDSSLAGPSGLTMSAISNTSTNSSQERNLLPDGSIGSMSWKINKNNTSSLSSDKAGYVRRSTIWEALPKEDMMQKLMMAVELIDKGNSYRRVSNMLQIPKSTIYSYVSKRREGRDMFQRKNQSKKEKTTAQSVLKTKFNFAQRDKVKKKDELIQDEAFISGEDTQQ